MQTTDLDMCFFWCVVSVLATGNRFLLWFMWQRIKERNRQIPTLPNIVPTLPNVVFNIFVLCLWIDVYIHIMFGFVFEV